MKKQIISCLLVFAILFSACLAFAEDFTLRSGIKFGDTMEDIVAKETTLTRESDTSNSFTGKVAGYSDVECTFAFDDDGKMKSMSYWFSGSVCTSKSTANDIYDTIRKSMVRQYGSGLGNTGGSCHLITGPAIDSMALWVYLFGSLDGYDGNYIDYDEWIVDVEDYHVKIDLISYYYRDSKYNYTYMVSASYLKYTDEDYDAAVKAKRGEQEEIDSDF